MAKVYFLKKEKIKSDTLDEILFQKSMCGIPCPCPAAEEGMALCRRWASAKKVGQGVPTPRALPHCCHCPVLALCLPLLKVPSKWSLSTHSPCVT